MLSFQEGRKLEYLREKSLEQGREPTTDSHMAVCEGFKPLLEKQQPSSLFNEHPLRLLYANTILLHLHSKCSHQDVTQDEKGLRWLNINEVFRIYQIAIAQFNYKQNLFIICIALGTHCTQYPILAFDCLFLFLIENLPSVDKVKAIEF